MSKRKFTLALPAIAAASALALGLVGCSSGGSGSDSGTSTSKLEQLKAAGTITVAVADERPYSWADGDTAKGATIAMDKQIFASMGIKNVKVVEVDWNSLIPGLNAGRFDAISAGMSILPERCKAAAFSSPEIMYTTALMVAKGNPKGLTDLDSVAASSDVRLAVLAGGIEAGYAKSLGIANVQSVSDAQTGMDSVANGRADAFAMTAISLNWMVKNNPDVKVQTTKAFVQTIDGVKQIGAGSTVFRKADAKLLAAYNTGLADITGNVDTYLGLVGKYGFTAENLPPASLTTAKLCAGDLG
jgi:polar amino acid transport system substrate-binding protein